MHSGDGPEVLRSEGAGGDAYIHVEARPEAHRPDGAGRDPYMHVGA